MTACLLVTSQTIQVCMALMTIWPLKTEMSPHHLSSQIQFFCHGLPRQQDPWMSTQNLASTDSWTQTWPLGAVWPIYHHGPGEQAGHLYQLFLTALASSELPLSPAPELFCLSFSPISHPVLTHWCSNGAGLWPSFKCTLRPDILSRFWMISVGPRTLYLGSAAAVLWLPAWA